MNEYVNPPSNSLVATTCVESAKASYLDEGRAAFPFIEGVSGSADGELVMDEDASTVSLAPNPCVVPDLWVAVQEAQNCVRDFLDRQSCEKSHLVLRLMIMIVSSI